MDTLHASINREYALRFLGVAALLTAFAGWFLYDGFVGYPGKNAAVAPIAERLAQQNLVAADWVNTAKTGVSPLAEAFRKEGLEPPAKLADTFGSWVSANDPRMNDLEATRAVLRTPPYSADDIRSQFISAVVALLAAVALAALVGYRWQTRYTLDDAALTVTRFGKSTAYPLSELKAVDATHWEKRGILRLSFPAGAVTLDAWHHAGVRPMAERLLPKQEK